MHGRSRMTIDARIPTMTGLSTSGFHRPGRGQFCSFSLVPERFLVISTQAAARSFWVAIPKTTYVSNSTRGRSSRHAPGGSIAALRTGSFPNGSRRTFAVPVPATVLMFILRAACDEKAFTIPGLNGNNFACVLAVEATWYLKSCDCCHLPHHTAEGSLARSLC